MPQLSLFADLDNRKLTGRDGSASILPTGILGDTWSCVLGLLARDASGTLQPTDLNVRSLQAAIGFIEAPPVSGTFTLTLQDPISLASFTSAAIPFNVSALALQAILATTAAGLGWTVAVEQDDAACWVINLTGVSNPPAVVTCATNALEPASFVRVRPFEDDNLWRYEVRLLQAPLSYNESGFQRVLPAPPAVARLFPGQYPTGTSPGMDEFQDLTLPPDFNGTFFLLWNGYTSTAVNSGAVPGDIAAALNGMFTDGAIRFKGTADVATEGSALVSRRRQCAIHRFLAPLR